MTRKRNGILALSLAMAFVVMLTGCSKKEEPVVEVKVADIDLMQGTWKGNELGGSGGEWTLIITGDKVQVDGPGPEDYLATLSVDETSSPKSIAITINDCAVKSYIGTTGNNIYKLEPGAKFTFAGTEPGSDTKPTSFEAGNGTRVFELTKVEVQ